MDEIKKYIKQELKNRNAEDIKRELVSKGYTPEQFENYFNSSSGKFFSRKTYYVVLGLILILTLIFRLVFVNINIESANNIEQINYSEEIEYSPNPENWFKEDNVSLDIVEATAGKGLLVGDSLQYVDSSIGTSFSYDGFYQGNYFEKYYSKNNVSLIEFTYNLDPNDGIPQIIIFPKIINNELYEVIFVDEDWKEKIVPNYIWWGTQYQKNKIFSYDYQVKEGIYMQEILDDRFDKNFNVHYGGLLVGDLTQQKIDNQNNNITFVRIR